MLSYCSQEHKLCQRVCFTHAHVLECAARLSFQEKRPQSRKTPNLTHLSFIGINRNVFETSLSC